MELTGGLNWMDKHNHNRQIKKNEILPTSHLGTRSEPEGANTGVKTGDADNQSAENSSQGVIK